MTEETSAKVTEAYCWTICSVVDGVEGGNHGVEGRASASHPDHAIGI